MLPQVFRQLCDVPTVQEFIGWFPVWVGTSDQIRVWKRADAPYIPIYGSADRGLFGLHEEFFVVIQFTILSTVLLQDNQVAAHLRTRVVREEIVRQACDTHQIGITHHILAYGRVYDA